MTIKKIRCEVHGTFHMPWQRCFECSSNPPEQVIDLASLDSPAEKAAAEKKDRRDRIKAIRHEISRIGQSVKNAAGRCQCCGWSAPSSVDNPSGALNIHHVHRVADGGGNSPQNLVILCPNCHSLAHRVISEYRVTMVNRGHRFSEGPMIDGRRPDLGISGDSLIYMVKWAIYGP